MCELLERQGLFADLYNAQFQDEPEQSEEPSSTDFAVPRRRLFRPGAIRKLVGPIDQRPHPRLVQRGGLGKNTAAGVALWMAQSTAGTSTETSKRIF